MSSYIKFLNRQQSSRNLRSGVAVLIGKKNMSSSEERVVAVIMVGGPTKGIVFSFILVNSIA